MKACLNAYYIEMWFNIINDMGADPRIAFNTNNTERKLIFPVKYIPEDGIVTLNLSHYAITDFRINKSEGYLYMKANYDGVTSKLKIPCEAVMCVMSKNPSMCGQMFDELMIADSEDGFFFELESVHGAMTDSRFQGMDTENVVDMFTGKPVKDDS